MQFSVDLKHLEKMIAHVRGEAKRLKVPAKAVQKMELACEEAIVNIISYAHPNEFAGIDIDCALNDDTHFEVEIRDQGPAFNPLEAEIDPQMDKSVNDRKIGGLGIFLIRKLIDEAVYQREGEVNILRLTLRLEVPDS
ncbi:MAG: ATP-binding protein [Chlamydiales bacterium]|nr:ATP-binding protein [Chlamydiales bacterium]